MKSCKAVSLVAIALTTPLSMQAQAQQQDRLGNFEIQDVKAPQPGSTGNTPAQAPDRLGNFEIQDVRAPQGQNPPQTQRYEMPENVIVSSATAPKPENQHTAGPNQPNSIYDKSSPILANSGGVPPAGQMQQTGGNGGATGQTERTAGPGSEQPSNYSWGATQGQLGIVRSPNGGDGSATAPPPGSEPQKFGNFEIQDVKSGSGPEAVAGSGTSISPKKPRRDRNGTRGKRQRKP